MGDTGPCGPCSEIHLDSRSAEEKAQVPGRDLVNKDNPQVIEIWNIVFMQYERKADGHLEPLGMNVIDTGMGFERLVRAIQGKQSNYDTDIFQPIIQALAAKTGIAYGQAEKTDIAMRVIVDHLRAISFSIADGQLPSNAKAGYVIRRILRRAVRYGYTFLDQKQAFMYTLVPTLAQEMGGAFPELVAQKDFIMKVMKEEEDSFLRTLENGIRLLNGIIEETRAAGKSEIAGEKAFKLFDTCGFPLDLTELICRENDMTVDEAGFNVEMEKQKARARNAAQVEMGDWHIVAGTEEMTGDELSTFVGYDFTEYSCRIVKYREVKQKKGVVYEAILNQTPFYGEMGGEVGDTGVLINDEETIKVIDTKKENGVSVHILERIPTNPEAEFMACVDVERRRATEANHSCTHLLDQALRSVLGEHVEQKGSLVTPDYLRFDFSHFEKVTPEQIREVEYIVNERIREDLPLQEYRDTPLEEAKKLGAIALFGEKYGDKVRVVQFGSSVEFCGGCHVQSTGRIGMVRIISESSVAAGVRRIEAVTGRAVEDLMNKQQDFLTEIRSLFNNAPDLITTIQKAIGENADLRKQLDEFKAQRALQQKKELIDNAHDVAGIKVISGVVHLDAQAVKDITFQLRAQFSEKLVVAIGSMFEGKPTLTVGFSDDMVAAGLNAGKMVREAGRLIQGGGGGQAHFATAGGKSIEGLPAAVSMVVEQATAL
jgi:alanyl-tRNA synthetase